MTSLAVAMRYHESALEYDLMTMTGRTLSEYLDMGHEGIVALCHFVRHLGLDSKLAREMAGFEAGPFDSGTQTNALLAELFDVLAGINANLVQLSSKSRVKRPKPFPRPWRKDESRIGRDPIPVSKFAEWWNSKSKSEEVDEDGQ